MNIPEIYIIGSLRNDKVPRLANTLREKGIPCFDSWYAVGPEADDYWRDYEIGKGCGYVEALGGYAGQHTFQFDLLHLNRCGGAVMVMPAGRSGHLELGYMIGRGKPGWILFEEPPERFDVMHNFATQVFFNEDDLIYGIEKFFHYNPIGDYHL